MDIFSCTPQKFIEDEENLLKHLEDERIWNKIPLLNANELHHLKDATLVRFRGMIQDMHSPEYYLEKFEITNVKSDEKKIVSGKYREAAISNEDESIDFNSGRNVTAERQTYVVISVPGINDWVRVAEEDKYKISFGNSASSDSQKKRSHEEMEVEESNEKSSSSVVDVEKKVCSQNDSITKNEPTLSKEYILNFPIPDRAGKACHMKVYRNSDELKLNDICEFVGFLAMDPMMEAVHQESDDLDSKMEMEVLHPPSSLVPRIHCVRFKKLKHNNPLLNAEGCDRMDINSINFIRKELLIVLTQLLLGDELAAEYLICHLISEVYLRRDLMPLGKFSLNISNIPKFETVDFAVELYKFIENFIPKSHYLPMTLANMNELSFIPKKDYECNRLTSGILQLSQNTHLIVDETKLCAGKLNPTGVNNVKAIANAIKSQKVTYDFNYYPLDFDCDIPFLILSEGKSMINVDVQIVLKPEEICMQTFEEIITAARHFLKPELLNNIRKYLTLARLTKYEITEKVEELVQKEFVDMRQKRTATAEDLHGLLVLARLLCISRGRTELDEDCWRRACQMEDERKARMAR